MGNNATFVDEIQLKFLKEMDSWLRDSNFKSEELKISMEVRSMITEIEKKGYYYEGEADLLNIMRQEYIKHKKNNPKKRL